MMKSQLRRRKLTAKIYDLLSYKASGGTRFELDEGEQVNCDPPFHANLYVKRTKNNFICTACMVELIYGFDPEVNTTWRWYEVEGENE